MAWIAKKDEQNSIIPCTNNYPRNQRLRQWKLAKKDRKIISVLNPLLCNNSWTDDKKKKNSSKKKKNSALRYNLSIFEIQ